MSTVVPARSENVGARSRGLRWAKGFVQVDNAILFDHRLDPTAVMIYMWLKAYTFDNGRPAFPSKATLVLLTGYCERTLDKYLDQLEAVGLVRVHRPGLKQNNRYAVLPTAEVYGEEHYVRLQQTLSRLSSFDDDEQAAQIVSRPRSSRAAVKRSVRAFKDDVVKTLDKETARAERAQEQRRKLDRLSDFRDQRQAAEEAHPVGPAAHDDPAFIKKFHALSVEQQEHFAQKYFLGTGVHLPLSPVVPAPETDRARRRRLAGREPDAGAIR